MAASTIKVDSHIPSPNREIKYPFKTMNVGDSFAVANKNDFVRAQGAAGVYAHREKALGIKFSTSASQLRIWRTA
jgi:hypothetical protein